MQKVTTIVQDKVGLHARPAALFVKKAKEFTSSITITSKGKTVNAKSLVLVLGLAVPKDGEIEISAEGADEQEAVTALDDLLKHGASE
jgi:phosphocarrier protein HPr